MERIGLWREEVGARPRHDHDGGVVRHLALPGQDQRLHLVVGLLHRRLRLAEARALGGPEVRLAVALHDVDDALALARDLQERVGELLLLVGVLHLLGAPLGLEHGAAVVLDAEGPGHGGLEIRVDDLPGELVAGVTGVLLEQILDDPLARLVRPVERHGVHLRLEILQQLDRLRGQAVAAISGEVRPGVVAVGKRLDQAGDGQHEDRHHDGVGAVAQVALVRPAGGLADGREKGQEDQHAAGDHRRPPQPVPAGAEEGPAQSAAERPRGRRRQQHEAEVEGDVGEPPHRPSPSSAGSAARAGSAGGRRR